MDAAPTARIQHRTSSAFHAGSCSESLAWFPRCRLAWLERKAKSSGHIGRAEIMGAFGISAAHASNDLQAYLALNPGALTYHTSRKRYEWTGEKLAITPAPWGDFPQ